MLLKPARMAPTQHALFVESLADDVIRYLEEQPSQQAKRDVLVEVQNILVTAFHAIGMPLELATASESQRRETHAFSHPRRSNGSVESTIGTPLYKKRRLSNREDSWESRGGGIAPSGAVRNTNTQRHGDGEEDDAGSQAPLHTNRQPQDIRALDELDADDTSQDEDEDEDEENSDQDQGAANNNDNNNDGENDDENEDEHEDEDDEAEAEDEDDDDAGYRAPQRGGGGGGGQVGAPRADLEAIKMPEITRGLTEQMAVGHLTKVMARFAGKLSKAEVTVKIGHREVVTTFKQSHIEDLTNLLFHEVLGPPGLKRLNNLVKYYSESLPATQRHPGIAMRASELALDPKAPASIKDLYQLIATVEADERVPHHDDYTRIRRFKAATDLFHHKVILGECLKERDSPLLKYMASQPGFTRQRGISNATIIWRFIARQLKIPSKKVQNTCAHARALVELEKGFTRGIWALLPATAMSRLDKVGCQRVAYAVKELHQMLPDLFSLGQLLDEHLVTPVMKGTPTRIRQLKDAHGKTPLLTLLTTACDQQHQLAWSMTENSHIGVDGQDVEGDQSAVEDSDGNQSAVEESMVIEEEEEEEEDVSDLD